MLFSQLAKITGGNILRLTDDQPVTTLITDSRKAIIVRGAAFFAIHGLYHDGHDFASKLYESGIRQFVLEKPVGGVGSDSNVIMVSSSIHALQQIAAHHRSETKIPVIGITGSNGKTIIKEWLYQLLSPDFKIAKNPASYNSQLGVPLSVWQIQTHHTLGIFEAGISTVNEMEHLEQVLRPTVGIFSNIGPAHDEGFKDPQEKIHEKLKLFRNTEILIYCKDHAAIDRAVTDAAMNSLSWGMSVNANMRITKSGAGYVVNRDDQEFLLRLPFSDLASIENCFHCVAALLHFGVSPDEIQHRITALRAVPMRLEIKEGINQCQIIDDTYNNDLAGLQVSLDFLSHQKQKLKRRLILSDIHQSGLPEDILVKKIASLLSASQVTRFVGIGPVLFSRGTDFIPGAQFYRSTDEFLHNFDFTTLRDEVILVKGARVFSFESIVNRIQRKVHSTVMQIDLGALIDNLHYFQSRLKPTTKIMAMVKALAYGSGSNEIANVLQYHRVDYLGVAYSDEGVELRKNNITLPIMVMNPEEDGFETMLKYQLEPEIYNFRILERFAGFLKQRHCRIHIKVDTGMRRLGFGENEIPVTTEFLLSHPNLRVASIFTHLAGADEATHDSFSHEQSRRFKAAADQLAQRLPYRPLYHVLNSSGILRFPEYQFDMVRLGIGLYGINPTDAAHPLNTVATLKTTISQIKEVAAGESVGYGRQGRASRPLTIATIAIGYADGFSRAFSQGVGKVLVNGKLAPVIGNVCMDMTMIDITGLSAREGDEVIVFGKGLPIEDVARSIRTIPYEILASTSERVKRVFVAESI